MTENVFYTLAETNNLHGLITFGDAPYHLELIDHIFDIIILARDYQPDIPLNRAYLERLVSKASQVDVIYDAVTFQHHSLYSEIIKCGSNGSLQKIKAPVPIQHVADHLRLNPDLQEMHIYVETPADITHIQSILTDSPDRPITYHIHYHQSTDTEYWLNLQGLGDVVFENIIHTLMPI